AQSHDKEAHTDRRDGPSVRANRVAVAVRRIGEVDHYPRRVEAGRQSQEKRTDQEADEARVSAPDIVRLLRAESRSASGRPFRAGRVVGPAGKDLRPLVMREVASRDRAGSPGPRVGAGVGRPGPAVPGGDEET